MVDLLMQKTTLYLPDALNQLLKVEAKRQNKSQAELMREALAGYIQKRPRALPRSLGFADDAGISAAESEDWIHARWRDASESVDNVVDTERETR